MEFEMSIYQTYPLILLIHSLSAVIWIGFFPVEISVIKTIKKETNEIVRKTLIQKLFSLKNMTGMIGAIGIILTGILLVIISPVYNFFEMKSNHWLTTKQFIILIILAITFLIIIPVSKKIKKLSSEIDSHNHFRKFVIWSYTEKFLVLINFLMAFLHKYYF